MKSHQQNVVKYFPVRQPELHVLKFRSFGWKKLWEEDSVFLGTCCLFISKVSAQSVKTLRSRMTAMRSACRLPNLCLETACDIVCDFSTDCNMAMNCRFPMCTVVGSFRLHCCSK